MGRCLTNRPLPSRTLAVCLMASRLDARAADVSDRPSYTGIVNDISNSIIRNSIIRIPRQRHPTLSATRTQSQLSV